MSDFSTLIRPELVLINPDLTTSTAVIRSLGTRLVDRGFAKPSLIEAALDREREYPTGLLLNAAGANAAIPHADREHVIGPAAAVAVLKTPVIFQQMDDPEAAIPVRVVFLLALPDTDSQLQTLRALGAALQDPRLITRLLASTTPDTVISAIAQDGEAA